MFEFSLWLLPAQRQCSSQWTGLDVRSSPGYPPEEIPGTASELLPLLFPLLSPSKGGRECLMFPPCLESQGCHLIPLCYLLQSSLCVLSLIWRPFHSRVTAVARKRPRSFCQKCRWQVTPTHAYALDPVKSEWADYPAVQAQCWNLSGNELTRNSSGNTQSQSSQLAEPLWTDPGLKSGIMCAS